MSRAGRDWVARLEHVSKEFRLDQERSNARGLIPGPRGEYHGASIFRALDDVSVEVAAGQAIGIVGRNGAGKSTVLKLLAGIQQPSSGRVRVRGRLASVIELGIGFDPALTGRENITFAGEMQGLSRREIRTCTDWVIEFSGIQEFLDMPVKRYSTGMAARLGFSVATAVPPDLLIVDEVLSVGDYEFQRKSLERIQRLHREGTALVLVSHNLFMMDTLCDRALLLDRGRVELDGPPREVIGRYIGPRLPSSTGAEPGVDLADAALRRELEGAGGANATRSGSERVEVTAEPVERSRRDEPAKVAPLIAPDVQPAETLTESVAVEFVDYEVPTSAADLVRFESLEATPRIIRAMDPITLRATVTVLRPTNGFLAMSLFTSNHAVYAERELGPSEFLAQPGTWIVEAELGLVPLSAGRYQFQLLVLPEDDRHWSQTFPTALAKATVDVLIEGDLTARPGIKVPMVWSTRELKGEAWVDGS